MREDHQKERPKKNTAKQGGAAYAPQQGEPHEKTGDDPTPDHPIGEVAYANRDPAKKKTGEL